MRATTVRIDSAAITTPGDVATGNASRLEWIALLDEPASIDRGEITDKGSINQRAVLQWRAEQVEALYRGLDPAILRAGVKA